MAAPVDPKKAVEELGVLTEQIKALWTEGTTWSKEERTERRREIVRTYVRVFAPAIAFSGVQLGLALSAFVVVLVLLGVSGLGYDSIVELFDGLPPVHDALANLDSRWGNAAIALILLEFTAPVLLPLSLALTPAATSALQAKLDGWGFDADGLNARIEKLLEKK